MLKHVFISFFILLSFSLLAQDENETLKTYRGEETKINNLIHTKLKVVPDFLNSELNGEAWLTFQPHFYPVQKLTLDAKSMLIHEVKMGEKKLEYNYENNVLIINLGNVYTRAETYELYIKYTARPELVNQKGSEAIKEAKGLYFIDPLENNPKLPTQIWTQGETESNSCWFPTIDSPNQKTTQELYITVPNKYTTLSNGILINQTQNQDETRTDYWKMSQPHAPYLVFMGVGEYSVVRDSWKGKPVDYYVEKEYEDEAKLIFGNTPEMIQFYSDKFGVEYPWEKYSQIVGRDYVSGAMENTTTTLHAEYAYQKKGQLLDENTWEDVISHELSHHWFGDLVTTESWSNLTVNESFATYAEYLWREYKYGKEHADEHLYQDKTTYLNGGNENKNLVRFHYADREDMFDGVSYQKGGVILHMLRKELGDEAFFAGLKKYLKDYEFGTAEVHQLRLALEEVSGKDLNPFFNQWYYANSHPKLEVNYLYDEATKNVTVTIKQTDKIFNFPLKIDVYENNIKTEYHVEVFQREHHFTFEYKTKPTWVNVNADHILLCEISDEQKTLENYIQQYLFGKHYEDRLESIQKLSANQDNQTAYQTLIKALNDPYFELRISAINAIDLSKKSRKEAIKVLENLATNDPKTKVRGAALQVLGKLLDEKYKPLFEKEVQNPSFAIKSSAILSLYELDKPKTLLMLKDLDNETKEDLAYLLIQIYIEENDESQMPFIAEHVLDMAFKNEQKSQENFMKAYQWISNSNNPEAISNLVTDGVSKGKRYKKFGVDQMILQMFQHINQLQSTSNNTEKDKIIQIVKKGMADLM